MQANSSVPLAAPLYGLVLAGGDSTRMVGTDKGSLEYHGDTTQAAYLHGLLSRFCERSFVSIQPSQQDKSPYASLPTIVDALPRQGPATGLLSAWQSHPQAAWLVVAVDLALLDEATLGALIANRRAAAMATAFRHKDGTIEPLCAVWEPTAHSLIADRLARGDASLRRCLEATDVELLACPRPAALTSIDSRAERDVLRARLDGR